MSGSALSLFAPLREAYEASRRVRTLEDLGKVLDLVMGLRLSRDQELEGMDTVLHAETAYEFGSVHSGTFGGLSAGPPGQSAQGAAGSPSTMGAQA